MPRAAILESLQHDGFSRLRAPTYEWSWWTPVHTAKPGGISNSITDYGELKEADINQSCRSKSMSTVKCSLHRCPAEFPTGQVPADLQRCALGCLLNKLEADASQMSLWHCSEKTHTSTRVDEVLAPDHAFAAYLVRGDSWRGRPIAMKLQTLTSPPELASSQ